MLALNESSGEGDGSKQPFAVSHWSAGKPQLLQDQLNLPALLDVLRKPPVHAELDVPSTMITNHLPKPGCPRGPVGQAPP